MRTTECAEADQKSVDAGGPFETEGYVCPSKGAPFELQPVTLPPLTATMVQVDVVMVGLCHTDISMRDNCWGSSDYPLLAGHEAVCKVTRVGSAVRTLNIGDRVGIAWIRDSCAKCMACLQGRENICEDGYQGTYTGKSAGPWGQSENKYNECGGCFARVQRIEAKFAVKIPDGVPSEIACPLLCGGGTVFEPICDYAGPSVSVGIGSMGGLGTAAVKLARLRGSVVTVLSTSSSKREAALEIGAHAFVDTTDEEAMKACKGKLDVIIDTSPVNASVSKYLDLLSFNGTLVRVGIPNANDGQVEFNVLPVIFQQKRIAGSIVTGTKRMKEMLELVENNLEFMKGDDMWNTEHVPMSNVNEAMESLEKRTNKGYRIVLEW